MPEEAVLTPDAFASPARVELAAALRDLIQLTMTAEPRDEATLSSVTAAIRGAAGDLAAAGGIAHADKRQRVETSHEDYKQRSLLLDRANPLAPGWQWWQDGETVVARGSFGAAYEGPADLVHGGWIALALDELLGFLNVATGIVALTGTLTVRYLAPTPLRVPLEVVARAERRDGRKVTNRATMTAAGVVTAEAEGTFIRLPEANGATS